LAESAAIRVVQHQKGVVISSRLTGKSGSNMPRTIVFDVNETFLDLAALDAPFAEVFGDASARGLWFAQVLQSAMTGNVIGKYNNFGVIGAAALEMVAERRGVSLSNDDRSSILETMRKLPAHPEVPEALQRLKSAGFGSLR
jgi:2-haloacid dehalogenase